MPKACPNNNLLAEHESKDKKITPPMKLQRHIIVTTILAAYALFMTFYFGLDLLKSGQSLRFYLTVAAEIIVIILTFFALRRRDRIRNNH